MYWRVVTSTLCPSFLYDILLRFFVIAPILFVQAVTAAEYERKEKPHAIHKRYFKSPCLHL